MNEGVALVSGATGSIGRAVVQRLIGEGCRVVGTARNAENLRELSGATGADVFSADICSEADRDLLVKHAIAGFGRINYFVDCAGFMLNKSFVSCTEDDFEQQFRSNFVGAVCLAKTVVRRGGMLAKRAGSIVFVGSTVSETGNSGQACYAASKAAAIGATRSLAREFGRHQIRFNVVAPGLIDGSTMFRQLSAAQVQSIVDRTSLGRMGTLNEVAECIAFVLMSSYLTGQVIRIDGGI